MTETKRVGVLTGGGDAPGLNPAIKGYAIHPIWWVTVANLSR